MVLNRGLAVARLMKTAQNVPGGLTQQSVRHSGGEWLYRRGATPRRYNLIVAEAMGGFMWWWILWHFFSEPGHIFGEFPYPNPDLWTDAELGIPPDDE